MKTRSNDPVSTLERRLHLGYAQIEAARRQGKDVASLEEFWISLLHEYEALVHQDLVAA